MKGLLMGVANETIIVTSMAPVLMNAFFKWFMAYDVFVLAITYVKFFVVCYCPHLYFTPNS